MSSRPDPAAVPRKSIRKSQSVTVHDVARLAGVSAMTVSRAVNTPDKLPPRTLAVVREAIAKVGYVPNLLAGGLRSNKSRLVAAVVPTLISPVFSETIQMLTAALRQSGYQLMLGQSGYADAGEDDLIDAIIGRRPDGIILTGVVHTPSARVKLISSGIPVVEIWDQTPEPIDMLVGFSHIAVSQAVCAYFNARGKKTLAMVGGNDERAKRRSQSFIEAAEGLGLHPPELFEVAAPTTLGSGRTALRSLLQRHPGIDAIFCSSDMLALGVLTEAQALGVRVPDDLGVMGFGDLSFARDLQPALTTVRIDGSRIGLEAARFIVERAERRDDHRHILDVGFEIVERDSV